MGFFRSERKCGRKIHEKGCMESEMGRRQKDGKKSKIWEEGRAMERECLKEERADGEEPESLEDRMMKGKKS